MYEVQYKKVRRCLKWRSSSESGAVQFFQFSEYGETEQKAQLHLGLAKTDTGRDLAMSGEGRKGGKVKGNHSFGSIYDLHVCLPPRCSLHRQKRGLALFLKRSMSKQSIKHDLA